MVMGSKWCLWTWKYMLQSIQSPLSSGSTTKRNEQWCHGRTGLVLKIGHLNRVLILGHYCYIWRSSSMYLCNWRCQRLYSQRGRGTKRGQLLEWTKLQKPTSIGIIQRKLTSWGSQSWGSGGWLIHGRRSSCFIGSSFTCFQPLSCLDIKWLLFVYLFTM